LPASWDPTKESVSAFGVRNPATTGIFIGTSSGQIFYMDPNHPGVTEMNAVAPTLNGLPVQGSIGAIRIADDDYSAFATFNSSDAGYLLKTTTFLKWSPLSSASFGEGPIYGLALGLSRPFAGSGPVANVFVSTDNNVRQSLDGGTSWSLYSKGLPARAHVNTLQIAHDHYRTYLYAATYGRSVWRTDIGGQP
jgi:hypothetical protein